MERRGRVSRKNEKKEKALLPWKKGGREGFLGRPGMETGCRGDS
jgi:hypothetical protein